MCQSILNFELVKSILIDPISRFLNKFTISHGNPDIRIMLIDQMQMIDEEQPNIWHKVRFCS